MNESIVILEASFAGMLLWAFWYFGWKPYRLDKLMQDLFSNRDELFLRVAKKEMSISFEDEVYKELREDLNTSLRFGGKLSLPLIVFASILSKFNFWGEKIDFKNLKTPLEVELEKIENESLRTKLSDIKSNANSALMRYLISTSPLFAAAFLLAVLAIFFACICEVGIKGIASLSQAMKKKLNEFSEDSVKIIKAETATESPILQPDFV
jgi:hypothetical protein